MSACSARATRWSCMWWRIRSSTASPSRAITSSNDDQLRAVVQLRSRGVYTPALAEADRQRMIALYAQKGRYDTRIDPQIIRLDQNRVDVVFEIHEGPATRPPASPSWATTRSARAGCATSSTPANRRWWRFLSTADKYDPEKAEFRQGAAAPVLPEERLCGFPGQGRHRRAVAGPQVLLPHLHALRGPALSRRQDHHRLASDEARSRQLARSSALRGDLYDGDAGRPHADAIPRTYRNRGYAFVDVTARIDRDADNIPSTSPSTSAKVRASMSSASTSPATPAPRTRSSAASSAWARATPSPSCVRRRRQRLKDLGYFGDRRYRHEPGRRRTRPSSPRRSRKNRPALIVRRRLFYRCRLLARYRSARAQPGRHRHQCPGINGVLAQRNTSIDLLRSATPICSTAIWSAGADIFLRADEQHRDCVAGPRKARRLLDQLFGYDFNEHLHQNWILLRWSGWNRPTTSRPRS